MDAAFTAEQDELRSQARSYLAGNPSPSWSDLADLGWTGVSVSEEHGGAGLGFLEEGVLIEELGRALVHAPFLSTLALLPALPAELQGEVAAGRESWVLALGPLVPDLDSVSRVAIVGGDGIYELVGFDRELLASSDETRPLGVVSGGEPGPLLASSERLPGLRTRLLAALALEATGVGAHVLELSIGYAKERMQFGRPIGSYQAIAHPLADVYVQLELGRSLAYWAAWCVTTDDPQAALAAAGAKSAAAEAAVFACERAIQTHGGIGFTWEHPLHRYYKRALGIQSWEASSGQLRAEVAQSLLSEGGA